MDMFTRGEADVLVGTQMIAKGLDIARVTLVGVVSADTGLYLPDFRAPERSLQLLMQVAGRAGRRTETTHSRVVVQTYNPDHYAIQAAARHDYKGFYAGEIRFRAEHGYPPYGQLARLVYSSASSERCEQEATVVARYLRQKANESRVQSPESGVTWPQLWTQDSGLRTTRSAYFLTFFHPFWMVVKAWSRLALPLT
jgi:primosomal protein N' (replication factor Y)